jgi:DNA-binding beta-propeller fold protein YncE
MKVSDAHPGRTDLVMDLGGARHQLTRPFQRAPEGSPLEGVSSVAAGPDGLVYVLQRSDPPVVVLDADGFVVGGFGTGTISDGHGITFGGDGLVWVVDRDGHQVVAFSPQGEVMRVLGARHHPVFAAPFNHPAAVAVTVGGDVYVADGYGNSMVHVFDGGDRHVHSFGGAGAAPGRFSTPHGIIVDRDGRVLVADRENDRVQVFDRHGVWLEEWRDLARPMDLCEAADGSILVTDQVPRLTRFVGGVVTGRCRPVASAGHGVTIAPNGEILLAEPAPRDRVVRLTPIP